MMWPWRRRSAPEPDTEVGQDTEAAARLAALHARDPEIRRLAHVLRGLLADNHLSPRIAALYIPRDDGS